MPRVITIVGTRPEIIKLSRVIPALDQHTEHLLIHTGQNYDYDLNQVFFDQLDIRKPDYFLEAAGRNATETIANVLLKIDPLLEKLAPDAVLILGDTNSALAAIAAKKRKIPIFHMEAGNRSFDERAPEEVNRRVVDHVSDINLVYTEHARRYLLAEGIPADRVIKTGSPMQEVFNHYAEGIAASKALKTFGLVAHKYFLVSAHREENVDDPANLRLLAQSLHALCEAYTHPVLFSVHPRTLQRLSEASDIQMPPNVTFTKPLGFLDYITLEKSAFCVISDSGTLTEESSILDFPAVTIRNAHERPEGMDVGTLIMSGLVPADVLAAVRAVTRQHFDEARRFSIAPDYTAPELSSQIVRIILSYIGFINRVVWRKA
jgi:UDP-N-acetylglucosamine 2-epimerase